MNTAVFVVVAAWHRDGSLSAGISNDLDTRLQARAAGKMSRYTRNRLPVTLASSKAQRSKSVAPKREAAMKKLPRDSKRHLVARRNSLPSR